MFVVLWAYTRIAVIYPPFQSLLTFPPLPYTLTIDIFLPTNEAASTGSYSAVRAIEQLLREKKFIQGSESQHADTIALLSVVHYVSLLYQRFMIYDLDSAHYFQGVHCCAYYIPLLEVFTLAR